MSLERKSQTCAFVFEHLSKLTHLLQIIGHYCGYLGNLFGNIRFWERWDPNYNPTKAKIFMGNASQINCSRNSVPVGRRSDLNESDLGEVYCITEHSSSNKSFGNQI